MVANLANVPILFLGIIFFGVITSPFTCKDALSYVHTVAPPAPKHLSLEQALHEGRENSPDVKKAKAMADESRWKKAEVFSTGFMPRLSAAGNFYFNKRYSYLNLNFGGSPIAFPNIYPTSQLSLDASLPLFDGFANLNSWRAAAAMQEASENESDFMEFQIQEQIRLTFYQALAADMLDDVAEQNVKTLVDHLNQTQTLRNGGSATQYDVLRVQVQLTEAQSDKIDAEDNVILARTKLNQLLGLEEDDRVLEGELPVPRADLVKSIELVGMPTDRKDLHALELRSMASNQMESARAAWLVPQVSLMANYTFYNNLDNSLTNFDSYRGAYNIGIMARWNLFDGGTSYAISQQSVYQRIQSEKNNDSARLKVPYDFDMWKRRYLSNSARYQAKILDVQRSTESVRLARDEQMAGTRISSEVLDAELDLFRSKAGVVNAQNNAAEAQIRLELALGRKL